MAEEKKVEVPQDVRGEVKESVGKAIGDENLERQGRTDQAAAELKDAAKDVKEGISGAVEEIKTSAEEAARKAKEATEK